METEPSLRDRLRALPVFGGELPRFDTDAAPASPLPLLIEWLDAAIDAGVSQPHAMALSTASATGEPSSRTLLLKDVDDEALWFASLSNGPKGNDLDANPRASLLLYWREQGRQVRITGDVEKGPRAVSKDDFLARRPEARARAIAGKQSEPITEADAAMLDAQLEAAKAIIDFDPNFAPEEWTAYRVLPTGVEFWQAERERDQVRLRYSRGADTDGADAWLRDILWP